MLLCSEPAHATPTTWAKARHPELAREAAALDVADREEARWEVERKASQNGFGLAPPEDARLVHDRRILRALEDAGGEKSRNPSFLNRLAEAAESMGSPGRAVTVEKRVLTLASRSVDRTTAFYTMARALARLGKVAEEVVAYEEAISGEPEGPVRGELFANQAEAYMVGGDVTRAVMGYRVATVTWTLEPTSWWGLGVALDRSGDLEGGLGAVAVARAYDPRDTHLQPPGWFFVPDYASAWYAGLGDLLVARAAKQPSIRRAAYEQALEDWRDYLRRAAENDPYLAVARARLKLTEKELNNYLADLERRKKERSKRGVEDDDSTAEESLTVHPLPLPH